MDPDTTDQDRQALIDRVYARTAGSAAAQRFITARRRPPTTAQLFSLAICVMEAVEAIAVAQDLTGAQKKEIVIAVVRRFLQEMSREARRRAPAAWDAVDEYLPVLIDTVVSASRGEYELNLTPEEVTEITAETTATAVRMCCGLLSRRKKK